MRSLRSPLLHTIRLTLGMTLMLAASIATGVAGAQEARFSGSVEVNNVTVEVEVTRRGKPVTGLRKEDFQVFEDGQEREITNFAWMGGGAAVEGTATAGGTPPSPTAARKPHVVLLFDVNGLEKPRLVRAVEAARQWVDLHAGQGILWSVAVVGTRPVVLAPFTADLQEIRVALDAVTSQPRMGSGTAVDPSLALDPGSYQPALLGDAEPGDAIGISRDTLQRFSDLMAWQDARVRLARFALVGQGLAEILKGAAAVGGQKTCVLFSGNMALNPRLGSDRASPLARPTGNRDRLAELIELQRQLQEIALEMGRLAATMGFRIYTVAPAGLEHPSMDLDLSVAGSSDLRDETSGPTSMDPMGRSVDWEGLPRILAEESGGSHIRTNFLASSLERVDQAVSSYYSIGFASPRVEPGTWRNLTVKVRRRGVRVSYRKGRYELDRMHVLAQQLTVPAGLRQGNGAFPIEVEAVEQPSDAGLRITATATVPLAHLTFVPEGGTAVARVGLLTSLNTPDGRFESLQRNVQSLKVPTATLDALADRKVRLAMTFDAPPGEHRVTMAVFDMPSETWGMATAPLVRGTPSTPGLVGELPVGRVIPATVPSDRPPARTTLVAPQPGGSTPPPEETRNRELARVLAWADGPARWLLTPAERTEILSSTTPEEVQEKIRLFWARRDPSPDTPENPLRDRFEQRVAMADALLGEPGLDGSLTDRGRVLILLGKPRSRRQSADLQVDTWFYDRRAVEPLSRRSGVPPVIQYQFRRDGTGHFKLSDVNPAKQEVAEQILATLPGALIHNPQLVSAPIPPLFAGAPEATPDELDMLAGQLDSWPADAVSAIYPEAFPGRQRRCFTVLRLPRRMGTATRAVGLLLDRYRRAVGSFRIPLEGIPSPWGTTYQLSIPVPDDDSTLQILLTGGGFPLAGTSLSLALPTVPPGATQVLPIVVGTNLEKIEHFYPWTTNLFGGNSLEVRPGGRFLPEEELVFFFVVINPPRPAGAPPAADVKVAVLRDGQPVARGQWLGEDLSMMAPRTFLFGSSFPLAALDGEGPHSLRFRVEIHGSEVARTLTLPLLVANP